MDDSHSSNQIPIDLFVSKKHPGLPRGDLGFADSEGNLVFRVKITSSRHSSSRKWAVLDQLGTTVFSVHRRPKGNWHGYKGGGEGEKEMVFKVRRTVNEFCRTELEVSFVKENSGEFTSDLKVKGCVFQRSFTIYAGDSIVAQSHVQASPDSGSKERVSTNHLSRISGSFTCGGFGCDLFGWMKIVNSKGDVYKVNALKWTSVEPTNNEVSNYSVSEKLVFRLQSFVCGD